jgi:hypothetical protein
VPDDAPHALVALGTVTLVCSEMRVDKAKCCLGRVDGGVGGGVRGGVGGGVRDLFARVATVVCWNVNQR